MSEDRIEFRLRAIGKSLDMINATLTRTNAILMDLVRANLSQDLKTNRILSDLLKTQTEDEIPGMIEEQKKILSPYQQMTEAIDESERGKKRGGSESE